MSKKNNNNVVSTEDCIKRFPTLITDEFSYNGNTISYQQRLITADEKETFEIRKDDVLLDEEIFDANFTEETVAREIARKTNEKHQRLVESNKNDELTAEEINEKVKEFAGTFFHTKEDSFKIRKAKRKTRDLNRENDLDLVVASVTKDDFFGGYFRLNGEDVETKDIKPILKRLLPSKTDELLFNANRLTYPTQEMINEVKP